MEARIYLMFLLQFYATHKELEIIIIYWMTYNTLINVYLYQTYLSLQTLIYF